MNHEIDHDSNSTGSTEVTLDSDDANTYYKYGISFYDQGKYEEAIVQYQKAIALQPDFVDAYNDWGRVLHAQKKYDEAIIQYQKTVEIQPSYVYGYYNTGLALYAQKRYDEAIAQYQKAIEVQPDYVDGYINWGLTLYELQRYDEAIAQFQKALEVQADCVDGYNNWGRALHVQHKYDEAIPYYQKVVEIQPDYAYGYNNWGLALYELQRYDEAIAQFQKAIETQPDYVEGYNNWGLALYELERYDEAIVQFQKAVETQPDYVEGYNNWGRTLHAQKKYIEAFAHYQKTVAIQPDKAYGYNNLGLALYDQKKYAEAIVYYQKAVEIQPDYVDSYYNWGLALDDLRQYDEAIAMYQKAIQVDENYVYALHNLAHIYAKQGKYQEAFAGWVRACQKYEWLLQIERSSNDADYFFYYGSILHEVFGELKKAELIYQQGLTFNANHLGILSGLVDLYLECRDENITERTSAYWKTQEAYRKAGDILRSKLQNQKDALTLSKLGELLLKMEEYDEAESCLLDAIKEDKELVVAYINLGVLYARPEKENLRRAAQYFEKAIRIAPDDLTVWSNLAEVFLKLNLKEKAEIEYKKILRITNGHVDTQIGLGEVYIAFGEDRDEDQYKQAIDYFSKSISLANSQAGSKRLRKKELASVHYSRAYARVKLYEFTKPVGDDSLLIDALADFKKCYELDPDHHKSARAMEKVESALNKAKRYWFTEKIAPWLIAVPSIFVFLISQMSVLTKQPLDITEIGPYLTMTFVPLIFLIIGFYLPHILKLKFAGIEIEKSSVQQITMAGSLGIRK